MRQSGIMNIFTLIYINSVVVTSISVFSLLCMWNISNPCHLKEKGMTRLSLERFNTVEAKVVTLILLL